MGGKEDDDLCGYGSIFIFAGQGSINQMIKVVEFCGSKDSPIIDFQNKNYLGIQGKIFSIFKMDQKSFSVGSNFFERIKNVPVEIDP